MYKKEATYELREVEHQAAELVRLARFRKTIESNNGSFLISPPELGKPQYLDSWLYLVKKAFSVDFAGTNILSYPEALIYIHSAGSEINDLPHYFIYQNFNTRTVETQAFLRNRFTEVMNLPITNSEYKEIEKLSQSSILIAQTARMQDNESSLTYNELESWRLYRIEAHRAQKERVSKGILRHILHPKFA